EGNILGRQVPTIRINAFNQAADGTVDCILNVRFVHVVVLDTTQDLIEDGQLLIGAVLRADAAEHAADNCVDDEDRRDQQDHILALRIQNGTLPSLFVHSL